MTFFPKFLLVALLAALAAADSYPSFGCQNVWTNASSNNNVVKCMTTVSNYSNQAGLLAPAALCILLLLGLGFFYPFFFCCRQCCNLCGGSRRQPGYCCTALPLEWANKTDGQKDAAYSPGERWCAKIGLLVTLLFCGGAVVVMTTGAAQGVRAVSETLDNFETKLLGNISTVEGNIKNLLADTTNDSTTGYAGNISNTTFDPLDKAVSGMRNATHDVRKAVNTYSDQVQLGASLLSAAPLIFLLPLAAFAMCNIRRCGPACCTCCYYFTSLLFCLLGFTFLLVAAVFTDLCGEVDRYKAGEPGILKLYAEPLCTEQLNNIDVNKLTSTFTDQMRNFSEEVCTKLATICDNSSVYDNATPAIVFQCSLTAATAASSCTNFADASAVIAGSGPKAGYNACGGGTVACNMTGCSVSCDSQQTKDSVAKAIDALATALRFQQAYNLVTPMLGCGYWFSLVLQVFDQCHSLRDAWWLMGGSFSCRAC